MHGCWRGKQASQAVGHYWLPNKEGSWSDIKENIQWLDSMIEKFWYLIYFLHVC